MRRSGSSPANPSLADEAGFTIMEIMVVLAVCSIALFSLWALSMRIGSSFAKAGNSGAASVKAATLDRALRSLCARVEIPFWAATKAEAFSDGAATIPYLDGEPASALRIEVLAEPGSRMKDVRFDAGSLKMGFDGFESFSAAPLRSADGRLAGVLATFGCGGSDYECRALFSSWSLTGKEAE
jgi:prepilin-type N-terminal cleavage/methylation domain-containing protein